MKLYLVEISSGQYSDHVSFVSAVFDNKELAEKYAKAICDYYNSTQESYPPYPEEDYYSDGLTPEQDEEYSSWLNRKYEGDDFNGAYVREYLLNDVNQRYLLSSEQNVQVSDTTGDDSSTGDGK